MAERKLYDKPRPVKTKAERMAEADRVFGAPGKSVFDYMIVPCSNIRWE